jgi:hypothetical protein
MLELLDSEVQECLRRADECAQRAKGAATRIFQRDFTDLELHWLKLASPLPFALGCKSSELVLDKQSSVDRQADYHCGSRWRRLFYKVA